MFEASLKERGGEGLLKEGDIVKGTVIQVDQGLRRRRHRLQVRRPDPDLASSPSRAAKSPSRRATTSTFPREPRERQRPGRPLQGEGRQDAHLGRDLGRVRARRDHQGLIVGRVKGGLSVNIGVKAFLPGSQVDLRPVRNLDKLHRQELRVQGHQVQQEARQHRALAPRAPREGARRAEGGDPREPQGGRGRQGHGQEPHRVRRVHRPRRHRRPAPHHRHVAGAASTTRRELFQVGDEVRVKVLKFNPETERVSPRPQADPGGSVEPRRREVPGRHARHAARSSAQRLRRVRRARAGRRGPGPRLRDVLDQEGQAPVEGASRSATRSRRWCSTSTQGQAHQPRHEAARAEPLDAARGQVPARHGHQGQGPQRHRLRHLRRHRGGHRRPGPRLATSRGPSASSTRPSCTRRATRSRRWSSTSTSRTSASASASSSSRQDPWETLSERLPGRQHGRRARSPRSSTSAPSWRSSRASRAWSTSPS